MDRALPRFSAFLSKEKENNKEFGNKWDSLWAQHRRWNHKASASKRQTHYKPKPKVKASEVVEGAEASVSGMCVLCDLGGFDRCVAKRL